MNYKYNKIIAISRNEMLHSALQYNKNFIFEHHWMKHFIVIISTW